MFRTFNLAVKNIMLSQEIGITPRDFLMISSSTRPWIIVLHLLLTNAMQMQKNSSSIRLGHK